jgi:hypothetical protein
LPLPSGHPIGRLVPLVSRFVRPASEEFSNPPTDLAAILDRVQPAGSQLPLARAPRRSVPAAATLPAARPRESAARAAASEESDAAWYAKMQRYLARQHGESLPDPPPARVESDAEWYAKMRRYLATQRASSDDSLESQPTQAPARAAAASEGQLSVGRHIRDYVISGDNPFSPRDQDRLDAIGRQAMVVCERELGLLLSVAARQVLPNLHVSVALDLTRLSDDEAAETWGHRLAEVVRSRLRRGIAEVGRGSHSE